MIQCASMASMPVSHDWSFLLPFLKRWASFLGDVMSKEGLMAGRWFSFYSSLLFILFIFSSPQLIADPPHLLTHPTSWGMLTTLQARSMPKCSWPLQNGLQGFLFCFCFFMGLFHLGLFGYFFDIFICNCHFLSFWGGVIFSHLHSASLSPVSVYPLPRLRQSNFGYLFTAHEIVGWSWKFLDSGTSMCAYKHTCTCTHTSN